MSEPLLPEPAARLATSRKRRRFGLDTVLPADPAVIEGEVLRLLRAEAPDLLSVRPSAAPDRRPAPGHRAVPRFVRGVPDLLLLAPGGRSACLSIRAQADRPTADQLAFQDLCRQRGIPFAAVRSGPEARAALRRFGLLGGAA